MGFQWFRKIWQKSDSSDSMAPMEVNMADLSREKPLLSKKNAEALKQRLLFKIRVLPPEVRHENNLYEFVKVLRRTVRSIRVPGGEQALMRQRILSPQDKPGFSPAPSFSAHVRVVFSSLVLFFFVVSTFLLLPFQIPVSRASQLSYIEEAQGKVFILRKGFTLTATKNFSLQEGDVIVTKDNGFTSIRFFDESTSRLDKNSQLELKRLMFTAAEDTASPDQSTQVEVLLNTGRMWTKVFHLLGDQSRFKVDTRHAFITATQKAAFDVRTDTQYSRVAVFDNIIDLSPRQESKQEENSLEQPKSLTAGYQAEVSPESFKTTLIEGKDKRMVVSKEASDMNEALAWFETNLEKDRLHTEKISQERQDRVTTAMQLTSPEKNSSEVAMVEPNEIEQHKASFLKNYNLFLQGQVLLMRGKLEDGMKLLLQFEGEVRTFMVNYPGLLEKDRENALALRSLVEKKIAEQRGELSTFLPGDPLYAAKEVLDDAELFLYPNEIDRTLVRLRQAEGKLLEIQDLVEKKEMDMAQRMFVRYESQMKTIGFELDEENFQNFKQKLTVIFDKQIQQMKILTVLEQSFDGPARTSMAKIRHDLLLRLRMVARSPSSLFPAHLIIKLKALLATYLDQKINDQEFVYSLNQLLVLHGEASVFAAPVQPVEEQVPVEPATAEPPEKVSEQTDPVPELPTPKAEVSSELLR